MSRSSGEALALSERVITQKSKSFRLASRLLAPEVRGAAVILYAWCRRCDDLVDEAPSPGARRDAVKRLDAELDAIYGGELQDDPLLAAFQELVQSHGIPRTYPRELLAGMAMDAADTRYTSLEELLVYCYRVAGTVGLMMCHVMGVSDPRALRHAAHLGIGMQLTNICRDVAEDLGLGRVYLPGELLLAAGASHEPLDTPAQREPVRRVVDELLTLADRFNRSGDRGLPRLDVRCSLGVRTARLVYAAIGTRLRMAGCDPFRGRAVTPAWWKLALVARALFRTLLELPRRALVRLSPVRSALPLQTLRYPRDVLPI
jgi:phytoene synthase